MGKMLGKRSNTKKHRRKLRNEDIGRIVTRQDIFEKAKRKYIQIWIFNYLLFGTLFLLVTWACWITKSIWIFIVFVILFYLVFRLHHSERIRKYEVVDLSDYQDASFAMKLYSITGVAIAFVFSSIAYLSI